MKKLTLNVDSLRIESFATQTAATEETGTVHGHMVTQITGPCKPTYPELTCIRPCIPPEP